MPHILAAAFRCQQQLKNVITSASASGKKPAATIVVMIAAEFIIYHAVRAYLLGVDVSIVKI